MPIPVIQNMIKRMEAFDTDAIISATAKVNEAEIIDMVFQDQLYDKGVMPDGSPTGEYTLFSVAMKELPGPHDHKTDHMTFKDEGGFYEGGHLVIRRKSFAVDSKDGKRDKLVSEFGNMLDLTQENLQELIVTHFRPDLITATRKTVTG